MGEELEGIGNSNIVTFELDPAIVDSFEKAVGVCLQRFKEPVVGLINISPEIRGHSPISAILNDQGLRIYHEENQTYSTFYPIHRQEERLKGVNCLLEKITDEDGNVLSYKAFQPNEALQIKGKLAEGELLEFQNRGHADINLKFVPGEIPIPVGKPLPPMQKQEKNRISEPAVSKPVITEEVPQTEDDFEIPSFTEEQRAELERRGFIIITLTGISNQASNKERYLNGVNPRLNLPSRKAQIAINLEHPFLEFPEDENYNYLPWQTQKNMIADHKARNWKRGGPPRATMLGRPSLLTMADVADIESQYPEIFKGLKVYEFDDPGDRPNKRVRGVRFGPGRLDSGIDNNQNLMLHMHASFLAAVLFPRARKS